eukprot:3500678-Prymnesium_polylepis.1
MPSVMVWAIEEDRGPRCPQWGCTQVPQHARQAAARCKRPRFEPRRGREVPRPVPHRHRGLSPA